MIVALLLLGCADIRMHLQLDEAVILPTQGGADVDFPEADEEEEPIVDTGELREDTAQPLDTADTMEEAVVRSTWSGRQAVRLRSTPNGVAGQLLLVDVVSDWRPDLVYVGSSGVASELVVWPGTTTGLAGPTTTPLDAAYVQALGGDFTGDGRPDLLLSTGMALHLFAGMGNGVERPQLVDDAGPFALVGAADLTGDGAEELVVGAGAAGLRVYSANAGELLRAVGETPLGAGASAPAEASPLGVAGRSGAVGVLAEARAGTEVTRFIAWDEHENAPVLQDLDVVRNGPLGSPMLASFGRDLDGDGASELVSTGATGLYVWNSVRSAVREVRKGDPVQEAVSGLAAVDLDGDGATDALELLVHPVDAAHSELLLAPSLVRDGTLVSAPPISVAVTLGAPGGRGALVAADLDDDACGDAVILDANFEPWLVRGLCRPEAP